jgi:hypothetical protein
MPRWVTVFNFVIPTGADSEFPRTWYRPRQRMRLSIESRTMYDNANKLDRKFEVA